MRDRPSHFRLATFLATVAILPTFQYGRGIISERSIYFQAQRNELIKPFQAYRTN